ncbi:MAG TPA: hypothetical protein VGM27_17635 [Acidobacteriaceae bacterium]|jgi:NAD(P)-dependent dehydrogenase (short-subunit alcohol dehydrogenase family)
MKIGFISMPLSGHLNPMTALARRLQSRGNGTLGQASYAASKAGVRALARSMAADLSPRCIRG